MLLVIVGIECDIGPAGFGLSIAGKPVQLIGKLCDFTDDNNGRRGNSLLRNKFSQLAEFATDSSLCGGCAILNYSNGRVCGFACIG